MDRKLPTHQEIQRLILISAASRSCLEAEAHALKQRLDVPARIRGSLKDHPTGWLFGSLASGMAASLLFRGKSSRPVAGQSHASSQRRSFPIALMGLALTAVRPLAKVWLTNHVKQRFAGMLTNTPPIKSGDASPRSPYSRENPPYV